MKPQQRKFIVEFKSSRRRSTVQAPSIWGDTDLKALAREAESEAPHLFEIDGRAVDLAPKQGAEVRAQEEITLDSVPRLNPNTAPEEVTVLPDPSEEASLVDVRPVTTAVPQISKLPRPARVRPARSKTLDTPIQVSVDDLAALQEENRRLKGLLARRLQQENAQLRRMLERFM
ncbi:hypothetical protein [Ensifer sp. 4252]|uniref:hypothetical protein n=1 Tax=Ensifer sp. 4252 TaxID=3373915 RepID=UPI003D1BFE4B